MLVYLIKCEATGKCYVGQTGKPLPGGALSDSCEERSRRSEAGDMQRDQKVWHRCILIV